MAEVSKVTLELANGQITTVQSDNVLAARGIPYARAERFQPPEPVPKWSSLRDCTQPAPICPQFRSRLHALVGPIAEGRTTSEDCLRVSVFAPAPKPRPCVPVMAFIHGGGYIAGAGDLDCYSGAGLAKKGVVVVNIAYRLGILGYQRIEGRAPANLGLMDQIAALKWIQGNIECFGGDPQRVCVFGESAGADSIYCLMGADGTEGLFQRAIIQSPPLGLRLSDRREMLRALEQLASELVPADAGHAPVEELLTVQDKLAERALSFAAALLPFGPVLGHHPLPDAEGFEKRLDEAIRRVPIFLGYNGDEGSAFVPFFRSIDPLVRPRVESSAVEYIGRNWFKDKADELYRKIQGAGPPEKPWFYRFDIAPDQSPWGAAHTVDMPFLLGTWACWKDAPMLKGHGVHEMVERVGDELKSLWVAFAQGRDVGRTEFVIDEDFALGSR
ncbi:Carboxylesterase family protein [Metarhizium album ARSEF 1941]|uniref:Carboxylic ester hydrolase n=1 Tax=Metarhizium album (strain ARSEF 1941) TaxID=1081103 RepID=A0A0B2X1P9_METAS|nr:Carboxylesterase family protein [Metarhizium album ARSEF 1941]KHN99030.1 Carboxylesterase family protein [Metarhizium album ARSEF 1941]